MKTFANVSKTRAVMKNALGAVALLVVGIWMTPSAEAQSFNCGYAKKSDEVLICQRHDLSRLDEQMAAIFFDVKRYVSRPTWRAIRRDQKRWLSSRMRCGYNYRCVRNHYHARIRDLRAYY